LFLFSDRLPRWAAPWLLLVAILTGSLGCVDLSRPSALLRDAGTASDGRGADLGKGDGADGGADRPVDQDGAGEDSDPPNADAGPDVDPGLAIGAGCAANAECQSGRCVDNVCCATACSDLCMACNIAGSEGTCAPIAGGEDPADECAMQAASTCGQDGTCDGAGACRHYKAGSECQPGSCAGSTETPASTCDATGACKAAPARACVGGAVCQGTSCATSCTTNANCQTGFFCETGACRAKRTAGATCAAASECASGYCVDKVCCGTPCTELCSVCNLAGSAGTCKPVPVGQDPRNVCNVDPTNQCGNDGTCNGAGACRRPSGTSCGLISCSAGVEQPTGLCNGAGTCGAQPSRSCGGYQCAGSTCGTSCSSDAGCAVGYTCSLTKCVPLPGPVIYWKLDETNGITAFDATTNGYNGIYEGVGAATPTTSTLLPPLTFPNAASRAFLRSQRHAIQLPDMGFHPLMKTTTDVTMSVWYRSISGASSNGEDLMSAGDAYALRVWSALPKGPAVPGIELAKHFPAGHLQCFFANDKVLDGRWHHLAGVLTTASMQVYIDGVPGAPCAFSGVIEYFPDNPDFWVGRHGSGTSTSYDFEGNIDEVRLYTRPLSAAEIARLAAGAP
jgi:hypothetical protein